MSFRRVLYIKDVLVRVYKYTFILKFYTIILYYTVADLLAVQLRNGSGNTAIWDRWLMPQVKKCNRENLNFASPQQSYATAKVSFLLP